MIKQGRKKLKVGSKISCCQSKKFPPVQNRWWFQVNISDLFREAKRFISHVQHVTLYEDQLDNVHSAMEDACKEIREGIHNLLSNCRWALTLMYNKVLITHLLIMNESVIVFFSISQKRFLFPISQHALKVTSRAHLFVSEQPLIRRKERPLTYLLILTSSWRYRKFKNADKQPPWKKRCKPKMSSHVFSTLGNHKTRTLETSIGKCCGSTMLTAA